MNRRTNEENLSADNDYQLWTMLDHLRYMIFRAREMELARYNITPEQAHILYILHRSGDSATINQMMDFTQHQHHSISTLINRMTEKGLVSKTKITGKGRRLDIVITKKGQDLLKIMTRDSFGKIFSCLSEEDKQEMIAHLCRLIVSSYKALGKEYKPLPGEVRLLQLSRSL
jgi:DNA-binding MarR family transcriptional regulator